MDKNRGRPMISYEVWGNMALFTDPMTKIGGELFSYPVPTFSAIKGITEHIYWKPTISYTPKRIRILNEIKRQSRSKLLPAFKSDKKDLANYTYLSDVRYQVEVYMDWGDIFYIEDRNAAKHLESAKRWLNRGGKLPIYLGTSDCVAYVRPCEFGLGTGYYDAINLDFGMMLHSQNFCGKGANLCRYQMRKGIIEFPPQQECIRTKCFSNDESIIIKKGR